MRRAYTLMLFNDADLGIAKRKAVLRAPPPIPETGWQPPAAFPNLAAASVIAFDVETKETDWDHGPGWGRGKGHIVGVSLAARDRQGNAGAWYFPVRHEAQPEHNLDQATVFRWLEGVLDSPHVPKVGANLLYDIGWLTTEGVSVTGPLHDVQFAEALLHEEEPVALDHLGRKYCGEGKETSVLYEWCAGAYGGAPNSAQRANIYRTPPSLVGSYAEQDADLPIRIFEQQGPLLTSCELDEVFRMECDSIPLLVAMRLTGVHIDIARAEQLFDEIGVSVESMTGELARLTGVSCNVNSGADLAKVFDAIGLKYPTTALGAPSFRKDWLLSVEHPIAGLINTIREHEKIKSTFIQSYLLESHVNNRVFCQFHPLRGDDSGTRSGRLSSSTPNLQNIPVRSELGKKIRALFIPDTGHAGWCKVDYSQIEYRMLAHFAVGEGSDKVRERYNTNPATDYHVMTQELVKLIAGIDIPRKPIKNINFGLLYGMGEPKLARQAGISQRESKRVFAAYHEGNPYVKATMDEAANEAERLGYVATILKRRSQFNMFEPRNVNYENRARAMTYDEALRYYGGDIMRAYTHKAINRKLQGSAADMIKKGMLQCYTEGVYDVIGVPKLQVHDETDNSIIDHSAVQNEAYAHMVHVLENAIPLRVPVKVDSGEGPNWGAID